MEVPTDNKWKSSQTSAQGAATGAAAQELGPVTAGPWNLSATVDTEQYGDYAVVTGALQAMKVPMDFESDGPIRSIHRRDGNADLYFVANREKRLLNANCTFRVAGKVPELWNPLTGERRTLTDFSEKNGCITVPLRFEPQQSWFVVFRAANRGVKRVPNFPTLVSASQINGPWQVSFDPKWGGPAQITFPTLTDWSKNPKTGIRYYSGKAVYRKSFTAPSAGAGAPVYLDLGTVNDMAQVRVNGQNVGTVWCAPYRVNVSRALRPGANQLEITIANRWPNRLIGDKSLPAEKQYTSTTWNPFSARDPLLPSGLLGPVKLLRTR